MDAKIVKRVSLVSSVTCGGFWARHTGPVSPRIAARIERRKLNPRKTSKQGWRCEDNPLSLRALRQRVKQNALRTERVPNWAGTFCYRLCTLPQPRTLIFEKESTARPAVGLPIDIAGRKVVKISMFLTRGSRSFELSGSERI